MTSQTVRLIAVTIFVCMAALPASAYVGPGAGLGLVAAFGALLTAIVAAVGFLLLWPLRVRRARRARERQAAIAAAGDSGGMGRDD